MRCFPKATQFSRRDECHVLRAAPGDDDYLLVLGSSIAELREVCPGLRVCRLESHNLYR